MSESNKKPHGGDWLKMQDRLGDLMTGFEYWKAEKCANGEMTTLDEMFIRWVEASPYL